MPFTPNKPKKRIYIDALSIASLHMSGVGHLLLDTIKALVNNEQCRQDYQLVLVLPLWKRKMVMRHGLKDVDYKIVFLPARLFSLLLRFNLLPPLDIFLGKGTYIFPNYRNWPLLFSRSITYCHDVSFILYPETVAPKNLVYLRANIKKWLARTNQVITLTKASKDDIHRTLNIGLAKIQVVPCGIDAKVFYPRPSSEIEVIKKKIGIKSKSYLLYVGNLEPRKNLERLLDAFSRLPDKTQISMPLVIVGGGGWNNDTLLAKIENLATSGQVIFPRFYVEDADLPALISGATALLQPSIYEGFGIPPLEAVACGTLPIVSDIASFREIFGDTLQDMRIDPWSTASIEKVLLLLSTLNYEEIEGKTNVYRRQVTRYNWDNSAISLMEVIEEGF